jgi:coniferyl-aldehyde dehydrogenase
MEMASRFYPVETQDLRLVFEVQRARSRNEPIATEKERRERLEKLRRMVLDNEAAFIEAISADFGNRASDETRLLEVTLVLAAIRHARKHLRRWMRPERRHVDIAFQPAKAWVRHEPLGVIGIIAPWNYPLLLALSPLVDAIAAGNRAMIKPSELTPRFSDLLAHLIAETYEPEVVTVVTGGAEVAQEFSSLPFDHLVFTGSTAIGRKVMQAAASNLTPVTLELGGKSPVIVCDDFDIEKAAKSIAFGKFLNAGQTCIAPDYAMVPEDKVEQFAEAVILAAEKAYPTLAGNSDYTSIVSDRHHDRLKAAVAEARAAGAKVITHFEGDAEGERKVGPTVVIGAPGTGVLMSEEIFGPVLPIVGYRTLDDVTAYINDRDRPLALYAFSNDRTKLDQILDGTISGGVTLNGTLLHAAQDGMAFGGVGPSGMGGYHGHDGFLRFSHARSVMKIGFVNVFEKLGPPWGGLARRVGTILGKRR